MPRPNVAPRPVCRYYNTERGCFAGSHCHYRHDDPEHTPFEQSKTCRFFARGFCKHGNECWFKHSTEAQEEESVACSICFEERPAIYGLLSGCSHAFCLGCIRQWRDPEGKAVDMQELATHKTCPMCRKMTSFVTPSSKYYSQDDPRKEEVIQNYKQSMATVPCRYFTRSDPDRRFCPFGRDCFYQHLNADGTPYEFAEGIEGMMQHGWRRRQNFSNPQDALEAALEVLEDIAQTLPEEGGGDDAENARSLTRRTVLQLHSIMMQNIGHHEGVFLLGEENEEDPSETSLDGDFATPTWSDAQSDALHSDDPRTPENAARLGEELSDDDFESMMEQLCIAEAIDASLDPWI